MEGMLHASGMPLLLAALVFLCLHGTTAHGLLDQDIWSPEGWTRFRVFAAIYAGAVAVLACWRPERTLLWMGVFTLLFTAVAAGPVAAAGILLIVAGAWAAGWLLWPRAQEETQTPAALQITLGLAAWASLVMWTAALPVHHAWLYWLLPAAALAAAWRKGWRPRIDLPAALPRSAAAAWCAGLFPLFAHWLMVLKPEVSADGLAMHMVIPARMASAHRWPFDPAEFAWALMPMGGDWLWTIGWQLGGEAAARLMNLLLLGLITALVSRRAARLLAPWPAALLTGALLSVPLVQLVTCSLFVENATALWLTAAALVATESGLRTPRARLAFGLLAGVAAATKFGALAFLVPLLAGAAAIAGIARTGQALLLALPIAVFPYANAWLRSGNPFFPFFNGVFRSPYYEPQNFRDLRFETPLSWTTLYDLTFHTRRFIEGYDGAAGFLLLALLPVCLLAWRPCWPKERTLLLATLLAGGVLSYAGQSNLRYLYPMFPLLVLTAAGVLAGSAWKRPAAAAVAVAGLADLVGLQLRLLTASGFYHRDFYVPAWLEAQRIFYLRGSAPERLLVDWLNRHAPGSTVAWFDGNAIGDFRGRAYTASWHSPDFWRGLREAGSTGDIEKLLRERNVDYVIAPAAAGSRPPQGVYHRQFLDECMDQVLEFGDVELRTWSGRPCYATAAEPAGPGLHDDTSPSIRFQGAWIRDRQFAEAHGGTLVYTSQLDGELAIRFEGSAVRLMHTAAYNRCAARVLLDGREAGSFDQHSPEVRWRQWSPWFAAAQPGIHTLSLRIQPGSPPSCWIDLDAFEVR